MVLVGQAWAVVLGKEPVRLPREISSQSPLKSIHGTSTGHAPACWALLAFLEG
jgi:hypothetical protein